MKRWIIWLISGLMLQTYTQAQSLKSGDKAPDFTARDQDGVAITLSSFKGKKVVLYFYTKDDTPGCTQQACNLRDNNDTLGKAGYTILGISGDDETSHKAFQQKYSLPFPLIADADKVINKKYGVWVEKQRGGTTIMGTARTTFLINEKGFITHIIDSVDTREHASQVLNPQSWMWKN